MKKKILEFISIAFVFAGICMITVGYVGLVIIGLLMMILFIE